MAGDHFQPSATAETLRALFDDRLLRDALAARRVELRRNALGDPARFPLSTARIEEALHRRMIRAENLRVVAGRTLLSPEAMRLRERSRINLPVLGQLARQGVTLVLNRLQLVFPELGDLAFAVGEWLGEEIAISGVLSLGSKSGLKAHHDSMNLFIIQLEGVKEWTLLGEPVTPGLDPEAPWDDSGPSRTLVLEPGDILFLPAGQRHICSAGGHSLHLGVMIQHQDASWTGDILADLVKQDPALHKPLLAIPGEDEVAAQVAAYRARLHELVDGIDLDGEIRKRRDKRRFAAEFSLPEPAFTPLPQDG